MCPSKLFIYLLFSLIYTPFSRSLLFINVHTSFPVSSLIPNIPRRYGTAWTASRVILLNKSVNYQYHLPCTIFPPLQLQLYHSTLHSLGSFYRPILTTDFNCTITHCLLHLPPHLLSITGSINSITLSWPSIFFFVLLFLQFLTIKPSSPIHLFSHFLSIYPPI